MKRTVGIALISTCLLFQSQLLVADQPICSTITDEQQRLACYDQQAQATSDETIEPVIPPASPLRKRIYNEQWLSMIGEFVILPHRPTYIMPVTYMSDPNAEPFREVYGDQAESIQSIEVKYQLSFKVPLWQEITGRDISMWFGYTQLSLWQMYNSQSSSPFRETNYEPELAVAFTRDDAKLFGMNNTFILAGLNHQSNGRSEPLSRSWNRLFASVILEKNNVVAIIKPWYRIPEETKDDDNPDIHQYLGYGELSLFYKQRKRVIGLRLWNNLSGGDNRTSVQLDWSFPIGSGLKGYVQYFNGYGETLVDYNYRSKRFGLGIMLTDWF